VNLKNKVVSYEGNFCHIEQPLSMTSGTQTPVKVRICITEMPCSYLRVRGSRTQQTSSGVRHEGADTETPNWPKIIGPWVDENARQSVNRSPVSRGIAGRPAETPDAQNSLASPGFSPSRLNLAGHVVRGRWRSTV